MLEGVIMDTILARGQSSADTWLTNETTFPAVWPRAAQVMVDNPRGLLDRMSISEVRARILRNEYDLWVGLEAGVIEAVMLTSIGEYTYQRILYMDWAGGLLRKYAKVTLEKLELYAQVQLIDEIEVQGRPAIARMLKRAGYTPKRVVMAKSVIQARRH